MSTLTITGIQSTLALGRQEGEPSDVRGKNYFLFLNSHGNCGLAGNVQHRI